MKTLLKSEYPAFLESLNDSEQKAIFVNKNKISLEEFLKVADFKTSPIEYEKFGLYIENLKLGKHPLHHAGAFYVQDPSAMFTVNATNFDGNELVLDMCAAPGGKSIQIANRLTTGTLVSNEIDTSRCKILYSNFERMGIKNAIITNEQPKNLAAALKNTFDVVLVDAPCSGEGMFRRGDEYVRAWNENLPQMCAQRQLEILNCADACLKEGGKLIYSTCTYEEIENEGVVKTFLQTHDYKLIPIDSPFAQGGSLTGTVRLYPHKNRGEGQFVAVLQKNIKKNSNFNKISAFQTENFQHKSKSKADLLPKLDTAAKPFLKKYTNLNINSYQINNDIYFIPNISLIRRGIKYFSFGVKLGRIENKIFKPDHYLFSAFGNNFSKFLRLSSNSNEILKYLKGETLDVNELDGYGVIKVENCPLGGYKMSAGKFKNLYPKGLRN